MPFSVVLFFRFDGALMAIFGPVAAGEKAFAAQLAFSGISCRVKRDAWIKRPDRAAKVIAAGVQAGF